MAAAGTKCETHVESPKLSRLPVLLDTSPYPKSLIPPITVSATYRPKGLIAVQLLVSFRRNYTTFVHGVLDFILPRDIRCHAMRCDAMQDQQSHIWYHMPTVGSSLCLVHG